MKSKQLFFDIGNTTLTWAVMNSGRLAVRGQILSGQKATVLRQQLRELFARLKAKKIEQVWITSVVPSVTEIVRRVAGRELSCPVFVVGQDISLPIKNLYRNPQQVGADRLVCAYAAKEIYGTPVIVLDLGTAITVDVVSPQGAYLGGMIIPGLLLSAEALFQKTALLPRVVIERPRELVGRDTTQSILSGLFFGYGAMLSGVVAEISRELKATPPVVLTGGYAPIMKDFLKIKNATIDRALIFHGMSLLSQQENRK